MTKKAFVGLMFAGMLAACAVNVDRPVSERERWQAIADRVEIIRDDFGVPHVYGKTDADTVFGLLYAQAEDDFPRIERNYIWAIGRLAEVEGEAALYSDLRARLYMTHAEAKAAYATAPVWLQALCDAWADGLNYFLETHPNVKPRLITRFEPWMPMFFSEGSIGGDIEQIPLARIAEFYGGLDPVAAMVAEQTEAAAFSAPGGSNGFAISGDRTENGNTLLLINPHTSFYFRGEVHAVSEEGLNAYGAVTWGQFFVYQGFNENTGWMHTSTYVDFMDEFVLDTRETTDGFEYRYGDEWRRVTAIPVTLQYAAKGGLAERSFTMYRSHHGPVTHTFDGRWVVTRINWDPVNALRQSYQRTKLANYREFREMMDIRTNSSNNTVFADSEGNIAYFHGNFVPRRDPSFDYSKPVDGADPATDWQGLHSVDETITLLNPPNGWIQNANSTPFTAAGEFSPDPDDFPRYMAPDAENFRGVHAVAVLENIEALTLDGLISLAHDPYLPGFESLRNGLVNAAAEAAIPNADTEAAIALLDDWDLTTSVDSVAMTVAHFYGERLLALYPRPPETSEMEWINALPENTSAEAQLATLQETLATLTRDFGGWRQPWGKLNRFQRQTGAISLGFDDTAPSLAIGFAHSRWGALADFGASRKPGTKKLYGTNGNSFAAAVEFGDRVRAKTILVGGQSNDSRSSHFVDQAERYAEQAWKAAAYYREDVLRRAERRYRPGERR
ncbi:MAG: penicillin acylase family protein [Pseudomonadota bacterium]